MSNFLQNLAAAAQKKAVQVYHTAGNDIAHIGAAPHPVNIAPAPVVSAIQNAKYGVLAHNPAAQQSVIHQLQTPVAQPSVPTGLNNAMGAFNDTTAHAGRIIGQNIVTRPAMEIAQTARQAITHKQSGFTPGSPQMKYIFGDSPIQSLQANHATTQAGLQHSSNPLVRGAAPVLAGANTLLHIANDVPLAGAALKGAVKGSAAIAPKAVQAAERIAPKAAPVLAKGAEALQGAAQTLDKGAVATTKAIGGNIKAASNKRGTIANYDATISDLQKQKADLQRRIQNTPINNHIGVEHTQRHIDQLDGKIAQVQASKPKLTLKDRMLNPNIGLTVGGPNASKYYLAKKAGRTIESSYKDLAAQGVHKVPGLSNEKLDSLSPEAIDALKSRGFKGVSNGKRTIRFDEQSQGKALPKDYLYHGTGEGEFRSIRENGLQPRKTNGGEYSYFADKEQYADSYAARKSPISPELKRVLRIKPDRAKLVSDGLTGHKGDYITSDHISPADIEVKVRGKWMPIQDYHEENIGILPLEKKDQLIVRHGDGTALSNDTKYSLGKSSDGHGITDKELQDIVATHRNRFGDTKVQVGDTRANVRGSYGYEQDLITLAKGDKNLPATHNHESIHKAIGQFLGDNEIKQLYRDIAAVRGGKRGLQQQYRGIGYKGIGWQGAAEEEIANHFNDFMADGRVTIMNSKNKAYAIAKWAAYKGLPQSVVRTFLKLSQHIDNFTQKGATQTAAAQRLESFYRKVDSGGFNGATRRTSKFDNRSLPEKVRHLAQDTAINAHYHTEMAKINLGIGMKSGDKLMIDKRAYADDLSPEQNKAIADYAEFLKQVGQGNGVDITADGRRVSNNYRTAENKGKAMTNTHWFDQARSDLESGKADSYAVEDYKQQPGLKQPTAAPKATPALVRPQPSGKRQLPASRGKDAVSLPNSSKQRGFVTSVKASEEVSGKTKQMTTGTYSPRSTAKLQANAEQVAGGDLNKVTRDVQSALERKTGTINDKDVANSIAVAKAHDAAGNVQQSSDIYEKLAEHLTKQGQSIQAASLLSHQTPEGLQYGAQKALKKAGVELTPEVQGKLKTAIDEIRSSKPGTERDYVVKKLQKLVSDHTPTGASDKLSSIWKAGLLTGVKTQTGNWLSNGTFQVLHTASNPLAVGIDKAISKFTGARTKSLTNKGIGSGLGEGIQKAGKYLKTGIDERTAIDNKYDTHGEVNFKNKALNTYVNGVFRLMGAADRPTYYSQLRNSLHDLALTDAANKGLPRSEVANHVKQFLASPPTNAFQTATNEAEKAVLGNDTALANIIGGVRQSVSNIKNPLARGTASTAVNFVAPFTKVPTAFLNRVIDFSPVGAVKEAAMQIADHKLDQRALSTALSEATTGTALIYLGYKAAQSNLLSGNYPSGDVKEAQRWKAEGIQPNSIKVGNKWLSLNYFGPLGLLFNAGQRVSDASKQGQNTAGKGIAAVAGAPKDLMGQSFLQGLSGFTNAVNDPTRSAKTYINSQGSSVVPTIVGDVATATDKMQRQSDTLGQTIQGKIPGARQALKPKQDIYGNTLQAKSGAANQLANPLRPSNDLSKSNPVLSEVNRLHAADPNNKDLQVTPTPVQKVVTVEKQKVNLTDKQRYDLQKQVGQTTQNNWAKLITTPEYQALDDTGKAKALNNLRTDSATMATRQYVIDNNLGTYNKAAPKAVVGLANGSKSLTDYTKSKATSTTPPVPKNPHPMPKTIVTTYDEKTKTWTQKSTKTGRTTVISADGTRTLTDPGTKTSKAKSTKGSKTAFKVYKSNLGATIKAAKGTGFNSNKYKVAKVSLSGKIKGTAMQKYKQPNLRKKVA